MGTAQQDGPLRCRDRINKCPSVCVWGQVGKKPSPRGHWRTFSTVRFETTTLLTNRIQNKRALKISMAPKRFSAPESSAVDHNTAHTCCAALERTSLFKEKVIKHRGLRCKKQSATSSVARKCNAPPSPSGKQSIYSWFLSSSPL